jgi:GNAT superfamily N-acetyltransferase
MAATYAIREANPDDTDGISRVHVETWQRAYRGIIPDEFLDRMSVDSRAKAWREWWAEKRIDAQELFVAELDASIGGFINVGPSRDDDGGDDTGEVRAVYVLPDHWNLGVGRALMETGERALAARFSQAILWTLEANDRTRSFYEKVGWSFDGTKKEDDMRGFVLRQVRYHRHLGGVMV